MNHFPDNPYEPPVLAELSARRTHWFLRFPWITIAVTMAVVLAGIVIGVLAGDFGPGVWLVSGIASLAALAFCFLRVAGYVIVKVIGTGRG